MNIAYITNLIEPTGGDLVLYHHIDIMKKLGHSVNIYCTGWAPTYNHGPWKDIEDSIIFFEDLEHLKSLISDEHDIVIANGLTGMMYTLHLNVKNYAWLCQNFDPYLFGRRKNIDKVYTSCSKFLLCSHDLANIIKKHYGEKEFIFCKNGIDYPKFKPYQKQNNLKSKRICYMVGYYNPTKDIHLAESIFSELKKRGYETIEMSINGGPLPSTTEYHHDPSFEDKLNIMSGCDITIHTSKFETWCLVAMESMAVGTPVIGTNSLGIKEYATEENSVILETRDAILICDEIESLCSDNDKYEKIQRGGIHTAEKYNWELVMSEIEAAYFELL